MKSKTFVIEAGLGMTLAEAVKKAEKLLKSTGQEENVSFTLRFKKRQHARLR